MKNIEEWNNTYKNNLHLNKYPSEIVISWVFTHFRNTKSKCLDVGCGAGNNLRFLLDNNFQATGIDFSNDIISKIKREFNENILCENITNTSFNDEEFDFIIDRNSIQHNNKNNVILAFNECFRLLKPNGKMFSAFLIEGDNNFILSKISQSDLINIVSKNFNIDEKNYHSITSNNGLEKRKAILLSLTKK
jgi:2-polyprenyl-3-methyl-5-hydroxy-6-metoxy-1,4-benzoquinol methylase